MIAKKRNTTATKFTDHSQPTKTQAQGDPETRRCRIQGGAKAAKAKAEPKAKPPQKKRPANNAAPG